MKDIKLVINFDMPREIESYIHRIGRTGRKNIHGGYNEGRSVTFLIMKDDWKMVRDLVKVMQDANQEVPRELSSMAYQARRERDNDRGSKRGRFSGSRGRYGGGGGGRGGGAYRNGQQSASSTYGSYAPRF